MVNGYVTLDLASTNIYKESLGAIKAQKPIMVVDLPECYFADTIKATTIDDEPVIQITKGGKTITINDVNAVSSEGDIQNHLYALTIHYSDGYGTLLVDKDFGNYEIDDSSNITNDDIEFLKSLKDHFKIPTCLNGYDGTGASYVYVSVFSNSLYMTLDGFEWQINLDSPSSANIGEKITFSTTKLF